MFTIIDNNTGQEANIREISKTERWAIELDCTDLEGWAIDGDGTILLLDECGKYVYAPRERFLIRITE